MTQEDKELLLKDLCARLPYGIKVQYEDGIFTIDYLSGMYEEIKLNTPNRYTIDVLEVKPYLFPLSSMTEEQGKELEKIDPEFYSLICGNGDIYVSMDVRGYDWINQNHFDYRGLIEKGLAIDATGLNIY